MKLLKTELDRVVSSHYVVFKLCRYISYYLVVELRDNLEQIGKISRFYWLLALEQVEGLDWDWILEIWSSISFFLEFVDQSYERFAKNEDYDNDWDDLKSLGSVFWISNRIETVCWFDRRTVARSGCWITTCYHRVWFTYTIYFPWRCS